VKIVKNCSLFCFRLATVFGLGVATIALGLLTLSYFSGDHTDRAEIEVSIKTIIGQPNLAKLD